MALLPKCSWGPTPPGPSRLLPPLHRGRAVFIHSGPESKQLDLLVIHSPNIMAGKLGHINNQWQSESSGGFSLITQMENTRRNVI